jgi:dihydrofolate reductase
MRRIINSTYISLDGVVEAPHLWPSLGHGSDERGDEIQTELLLSCDALLMGRHTYDGFAPVWPTRSGDPASDHINAMSKYVASTTLKDPADLLFGTVPTTIFRLVDTTALTNGIVILSYETEKQLT